MSGFLQQLGADHRRRTAFRVGIRERPQIPRELLVFGLIHAHDLVSSHRMGVNFFDSRPRARCRRDRTVPIGH